MHEHAEIFFEWIWVWVRVGGWVWEMNIITVLVPIPIHPPIPTHIHRHQPTPTGHIHIHSHHPHRPTPTPSHPLTHPTRKNSSCEYLHEWIPCIISHVLLKNSKICICTHGFMKCDSMHVLMFCIYTQKK